MKRYVVEMVGSLLLCIAISFTGNPLAMGLIFMMASFIGAELSGGHFNPVVTMATAARKSIELRDAAFYCLAQFMGALVALALFGLITHELFLPDLTSLFPFWIVALVELFMSFLFALTFLTTHRHHRLTGMQPIALGLSLTALAFIGALFNPALGLAALIIGIIKGGGMAIPSLFFVYTLAPLVGGVLAAYGYRYLYE